MNLISFSLNLYICKVFSVQPWGTLSLQFITYYNLLLIRRKLASEYDQMRLTTKTKTSPNNYNKIYLRILEINNLKSNQSNNNSLYSSLKNKKSSMSLILAGRLFHNTGAAVWNDLSPRVFFVFLMGNCNSSSSEERRWYLHLSFNLTKLQI